MKKSIPPPPGKKTKNWVRTHITILTHTHLPIPIPIPTHSETCLPGNAPSSTSRTAGIRV
ncbi:hypothetical protein M951_chr3195 (nucleomorph) [Lotharella oceanica]|uniref:Uncharacterized protein n=1 Tax=Lotharella oceanica TaxID=641309 RepID=A0A060DG13_9EUKA|nr:hypothetical protein M951_chr110 [Lotharella oceanica]AIB09700.1 hypothetical protein M951_chr1221 [Lotharella oceanica]AIB09713.1 hypothetical protein M951_chr210 [Lotharella oceanica]AIB09903.1 hypothetical protein M951_chr2211 [Lotharella oceanica]AIB09916.1 hypothetical protein M951_chr310 [Lotharella oceanica]